MHRAQSKRTWKSGTSRLSFPPLLQVSILLRTFQVGCRHWPLLEERNGAAESKQPPQEGSVPPIVCKHPESLLMLQDQASKSFCKSSVIHLCSWESHSLPRTLGHHQVTFSCWGWGTLWFGSGLKGVDMLIEDNCHSIFPLPNTEH